MTCWKRESKEDALEKQKRRVKGRDGKNKKRLGDKKVKGIQEKSVTSEDCRE